jgi:hypothetical protein
MRGSIEAAPNELAAVAVEGAQAIRAIIPQIVAEIKTVAEFNSMARTMPEITSLVVRARVELFTVMPDVGPGGGSKMIGEHSEIENVYTNAILEFRKKHG